MNLPCEGDQYCFKLDMPWNGRSPRTLTRAAVLFSFVRSGTGPPNLRPIDAVQLTLFPEEKPYGS